MKYWVLRASAGPHQLPGRDSRNDDTGTVAVEPFRPDGDLTQGANQNKAHDPPPVSPLINAFACGRSFKLTKDDRDDLEIVAKFIFEVRVLSEALPIFEHPHRESKQHLCSCITMTFRSSSTYVFGHVICKASHSCLAKQRQDGTASRRV
jgi:hypothetical protein